MAIFGNNPPPSEEVQDRFYYSGGPYGNWKNISDVTDCPHTSAEEAALEYGRQLAEEMHPKDKR